MVRMIILVARVTTTQGAREPEGPKGRLFRGPKGPTGRHISKKCNFLWGVDFLGRPIAMDLGPRGPKGPHGAPWGPTGPRGAPQGPLGPQGALGPLG